MNVCMNTHGIKRLSNCTQFITVFLLLALLLSLVTTRRVAFRQLICRSTRYSGKLKRVCFLRRVWVWVSGSQLWLWRMVCDVWSSRLYRSSSRHLRNGMRLADHVSRHAVLLGWCCQNIRVNACTMWCITALALHIDLTVPKYIQKREGQ